MGETFLLKPIKFYFLTCLPIRNGLLRRKRSGPISFGAGAVGPMSDIFHHFFDDIISAFNPKLGIKGAPVQQKLQCAASSQTLSI